MKCILYANAFHALQKLSIMLNGLAFFTIVLQRMQKPAFFFKTSGSSANMLKRRLTETHCIVFNRFTSLQTLFLTLCKHVTLYNGVCFAVTLHPL